MDKPKSMIALAIGKKQREEEEMEEDDYSSETSSEEIDAMRMFEKASDPESKAKALKLFLEACGAV